MDAVSEDQGQAAGLPGLGERAPATAAVAFVSAIGPVAYAAASWWSGGNADWPTVGIHSLGLFAASGLTIAATLLLLKKIVDGLEQ